MASGALNTQAGKAGSRGFVDARQNDSSTPQSSSKHPRASVTAARDCLETQLFAQHQGTSWPETTLSQSDVCYPAASTFLSLPCITIYPKGKSTVHSGHLLEKASKMPFSGGSPSSANTPGSSGELGLSHTELWRGQKGGHEQALAYLPVISWLRDGVQMGWM